VAVGIGSGDETAIGVGLFAVDVEELGGGLEVRAGEAGVGVRAVLLGRPTAVAVRERFVGMGGLSIEATDNPMLFSMQPTLMVCQLPRDR
jgi:hypothetical protein